MGCSGTAWGGKMPNWVGSLQIGRYASLQGLSLPIQARPFRQCTVPAGFADPTPAIFLRGLGRGIRTVCTVIYLQWTR